MKNFWVPKKEISETLIKIDHNPLRRVAKPFQSETWPVHTDSSFEFNFQ